jgi:hypothetical protein
MATTLQDPPYEKLNLPPELRELIPLIESDLKAVISMITAQADDRLMLTRREIRDLQRTLWNRLASSINTVARPLTAEAR